MGQDEGETEEHEEQGSKKSRGEQASCEQRKKGSRRSNKTRVEEGHGE